MRRSCQRLMRFATDATTSRMRSSPARNGPSRLNAKTARAKQERPRPEVERVHLVGRSGDVKTPAVVIGPGRACFGLMCWFGTARGRDPPVLLREGRGGGRDRRERGSGAGAVAACQGTGAPTSVHNAGGGRVARGALGRESSCRLSDHEQRQPRLESTPDVHHCPWFVPGDPVRHFRFSRAMK